MSSLSRGTSRLYLYRSGADDIHLNLAREEFLFDTLPADSCAFLLYVDSPAVVVGKHQNPWRECSPRVLRERGISLARRISGGGTVYHDRGNLNFSFILPKIGFDRRSNLALVVRALRRLGVEAQISERHDIFVGERKISGNAFCFRHERALHHGTLLVHTQLEALHGALVGLPAVETFAVESNPAAVANLTEFQPGIDIDTLAGALTEEARRSMCPVAGSERIGEKELERDEVRALAARNRTVEWLYDRTPKFTVVLDVPRSLLPEGKGASTGAIGLKLTVEAGRITSDSAGASEEPQTGPRRLLAGRLVGLRFDSSEIARALGEERAFSSLARWFREQPF